MENLYLEITRDEITRTENAEKLELISNANMVTKEELLHKFVAKHVTKKRSLLLAKCLLNMKQK